MCSGGDHITVSRGSCEVGAHDEFSVKVQCLYYRPGLTEVCRGWWWEGGVSGVGGNPSSRFSLRAWGPAGPTRGRCLSVCHSLTQDYSAIIELVETLQALPTCDVAEQHNVRFHYTFALNR